LETELKFQVPAARRAALRRAVATASAQTTRLQAVYADTADLRLGRAGLALRLRKEGPRWVQTLKGRGDGLMQRQEHEVPLPPQHGVPVLDPARHTGTAVGDRLAALLSEGADGALLQPLYRTDIRRLHRTVRFQGATIEIAYDQGQLLAQGRRVQVDEIEFELKHGPPAALPELARRWAARHGLWWDCRTKSERGTRLALDLASVPPVAAQAVGWPADAAPAAVFRAALTAALAQALPNAAELASGTGAPEHLHQLRLALRRLRSVLRLLAPWAGAEGTAHALDAAWRAPFARLGAVRDAQLQSRRPDLDIGDELRGAEFTDLLLRTLALTMAPVPAPGTGPSSGLPGAGPSCGLPGLARDTLRRAWSAFKHDARAFATADVERQHRARKRLKRFRHVLAVLQPLFKPASTERLLQGAHAALEALGRLHDLQLRGDAATGKSLDAAIQALARLRRARPRWLRG
jgi:inorganic triphosphatase YgiF